MKKKLVLNVIKALGLVFASSAVNYSCIMIFGQEKLPDGIKHLRRF